MTKRPNVLFLLLDAVRYDVFENLNDARTLAPNLTRLAEKGILERVVSNGMITKVAMAPLLTQTYPLDYGGYNDVIAGRPASFVELFRDAGYTTYMQINHFVTGPTGRAERGAQLVDSVWDHHMVLEMYFNHVLNHELALWSEGERSDSDIAARILGEMHTLLEYVEGSADRVDFTFLPRRLRKLSSREASRYAAERALIRRDPLAVARKILSLPPKFYRHYLGHEIAGASVRWWRWADSARVMVNRLLQLVTRQPVQIFPGYVAPVAGEVRRIAEGVLAELPEPWFAFLHVMDAHDSKRLNRPLNVLRKFLYLPRLWRIERKGAGARGLLYDLSIAYMDDQIGKLLRHLNSDGSAGDLIVVGVGDHGFGWDRDRSRSLLGQLGFRTHYEHICVPCLMSPVERSVQRDGVFDSMSVSATLLDLIGLSSHSSFRGRSMFDGGRSFSLVETVGRGNSDLTRRDIFFTLSTTSHKLMVQLSGSELTPCRFYNLVSDPRELRNLVEDHACQRIIRQMLETLWGERESLLQARGVVRPSTDAA